MGDTPAPALQGLGLQKASASGELRPQGGGTDGMTPGHSLEQFPQILFNERKRSGERRSGERTIKEVS